MRLANFNFSILSNLIINIPKDSNRNHGHQEKENSEFSQDGSVLKGGNFNFCHT